MRRIISSSASLAFAIALLLPGAAASAGELPPQKVQAAAEDDKDSDGLADADELARGTDLAIADTDGDGLRDGDEVFWYSTDPKRADTDGDGSADGDEFSRGLSPLQPGWTLADADTDLDGLNDAMESAFGTNPSRVDSDSDGWSDGTEVKAGYDPRSTDTTPLPKRIAIHTKSQKLDFSLGGVKLGEETVSTGKKSTPTPLGSYVITAKAERAWSRMAKLWMPWWLNFTGRNAPKGMYAIHELPEWPNGKKEGENHLGIPVSHGCVRLGVGPAESLYRWATIGTEVVVSAD